MKMLSKKDMKLKDQVSHVRAERDVLAEAAAKNDWTTTLYVCVRCPRYSCRSDTVCPVLQRAWPVPRALEGR